MPRNPYVTDISVLEILGTRIEKEQPLDAQSLIKRTLSDLYVDLQKKGVFSKTAEEWGIAVLDEMNTQATKRALTITEQAEYQKLYPVGSKIFFEINEGDSFINAIEGTEHTSVIDPSPIGMGVLFESLFLNKPANMSSMPDIRGAIEIKTVVAGAREIHVGGATLPIRAAQLGEVTSEAGPMFDELTKNLIAVIKILEKMSVLLLIRTKIEERQGKSPRWIRFYYESVFIYAQLKAKELIASVFGEPGSNKIESFFKVETKQSFISNPIGGEQRFWKAEIRPMLFLKERLSERDPFTGAVSVLPAQTVNKLYGDIKDFFSITGARKTFVETMVKLQKEEKLFDTTVENKKYYHSVSSTFKNT